MSPRNRAILVAATLAVMIALFVVLQPTNSTDDDSGPSEATRATPTTPAETAPAPTTSTATAEATTPKPVAKRIAVKGLKPVGGIEDLEFEKGDIIRFVVTSDRADNVHLHGYDVEKDVGPGQPASFSVKADIEGIFEVELENSAVPIAELTVVP